MLILIINFNSLVKIRKKYERDNFKNNSARDNLFRKWS